MCIENCTCDLTTGFHPTHRLNSNAHVLRCCFRMGSFKNW